MIPIGVLVYVQHKKFKRLAVWCVVGALAAMIYFYRYDFSVEMSHTHAQNNVVSLFEHLSPSFYATFLGAISAAANPLPAIVFGTVLTGVFLIATFDRLYARHPELYYSALFFVVTAVAFLGTDRLMGL